MIETIRQMAKSLELDDTRFAGNQIVLFKAYTPAAPAPKGMLHVSQYYPASNSAYFAAKALCQQLNELGLEAQHDTKTHAKAIALKTGGFIGDNSLYFHETLGSTVCIQIIETNRSFEQGEAKSSTVECHHCGACQTACPTGAIIGGQTDYNLCIRQHLFHDLPLQIQKHVYQLFGCELCQRVCPLNNKEEEERLPKGYPIEDVLLGVYHEEIKRTCGKNVAKPGYIQAQARMILENQGV